MTKKPEQIIQTGVFSNLTPLMHLQNYSQFMAFQVRNETGMAGKKGEIVGGIAKCMGTMAGVSDAIFLFPEEKIIIKEEYIYGSLVKTTETTKPPKIVFVEFKAYKPLKTKEKNVESLLSDKQKRFRDRVEGFGFKFRTIAATDIDDALKQVYSLLRENGVKL